MLILLKQREHILNEAPNCVLKQEWNLDVKIPMLSITFHIKNIQKKELMFHGNATRVHSISKVKWGRITDAYSSRNIET